MILKILIAHTETAADFNLHSSYNLHNSYVFLKDTKYFLYFFSVNIKIPHKHYQKIKKDSEKKHAKKKKMTRKRY